jgi:hypothetical protein
MWAIAEAREQGRKKTIAEHHKYCDCDKPIQDKEAEENKKLAYATGYSKGFTEGKTRGIIRGRAEEKEEWDKAYRERIGCFCLFDREIEEKVKQAKSEGIKIGENIGFGQGRKFTEDRLWDFISGKTKKDPTTAFTSGKSRDIAWEFQRSKQIGEDNLKKRLLNDED